MTTFTQVLKGPLPAAAVITASLAVIAAGFVGSDDQPSRGKASSDVSSSNAKVFHVESLEATSAASLKDWAALADAVAEVTVVSERQVDLGDSSADTEPIGRSVVLQVNDVVWSSPSAGQKLPVNDIEVSAYGWMRLPDGQTLEQVAQGASRLEVGHQYVVALRWLAGTCSEGAPGEAKWITIGSGAILPADNDVIGSGEFEGAVGDNVGPQVARTFAGSAPRTVGNEIAKIGPSQRRAYPGATGCKS